MAAEICCDLGLQQIQLERDAKVVVEVVNSTISDDSCRGHLTEDIRTMLLQCIREILDAEQFALYFPI